VELLDRQNLVAIIRNIFSAANQSSFFLVVTLCILIVMPLREMGAQTLAIAHPSPPANSGGSEKPKSPPGSLQSTNDQAIPLPQIAERAEELDEKLFEITKYLDSDRQELPTQNAIREQADEIRQRASLLDNIIIGMPVVLELRDENQYWANLNRRYAARGKSLSGQATYLQNQARSLEAMQAEWQATWDQVHRTSGITAVVGRVRGELDKIDSLRLRLQKELSLTVTLQNEVSESEHQISGALSKLNEAKAKLRDHLFERDVLPLWNTERLRSLKEPAVPIQQTVDRNAKSTQEFFRTNALFIIAIVLLYGVALLAALRIRGYVSNRSDLNLPLEAVRVVSRPFSVALLIALLGTIGRFDRVNSGVASILFLLWVVQTTRLLPLLIGPGARSVLYALAPFFLLETARILMPVSASVKRELFGLNVFAAFISLLFVTFPSRSRSRLIRSRTSKLFVFSARVSMFLLATSFASDVFGFLNLSQVLGISGLFGFWGAAALYSGARVLALVFIVLERSDWVRSLLDPRTESFERWVGPILLVGAALTWLRGMLQLFVIYDPFVQLVSRVLRYPLGYGNIRFTLAGVLGILLATVVGYAVARIFTFGLRQFLISKVPMQRGMPYAISKVTYYVLMVAVVTIALTGAGLDLNKFTVLTGTLGVGLGFGLQNIVNNFVSGLILLFERPIHIGDTVDVGGLVGTVRRIGARASTIVTSQGAEVIVPNSTLISNQVINWTLSSPWRRVDVPVSVAYGTDPELVLKLLVDAAESHPGVLHARPPAAFFLGFGDSALKFELRFWSARQDTWFQLQSEVTVAVEKALREAKIAIPFPQRDLHLRSIDLPVGQSVYGGLSQSASPSRPPGADSLPAAPQTRVVGGAGTKA
jgi:potassium-dependent mechanosensitive channel